MALWYLLIVANEFVHEFISCISIPLRNWCSNLPVRASRLVPASFWHIPVNLGLLPCFLIWWYVPGSYEYYKIPVPDLWPLTFSRRYVSFSWLVVFWDLCLSVKDDDCYCNFHCFSVFSEILPIKIRTIDFYFTSLILLLYFLSPILKIRVIKISQHSWFFPWDSST